VTCLAALGLAQVPLTWRLLRRLRRLRYLAFVVMSFVRAYWRGIGLIQGMLVYVASRLGGRRGD
jgi:hypothetical protein